MNRHLAGVFRRFVAGVVAMAVIGVSAFTIPAPSQHSAAGFLNNIQTDNTTLFYTNRSSSGNWFVEQVLPATRESKDATENLKVVAAAL
jgi:hypothetical protein